MATGPRGAILPRALACAKLREGSSRPGSESSPNMACDAPKAMREAPVAHSARLRKISFVRPAEIDGLLIVPGATHLQFVGALDRRPITWSDQAMNAPMLGTSV